MNSFLKFAGLTVLLFFAVFLLALPVHSQDSNFEEVSTNTDENSLQKTVSEQPTDKNSVFDVPVKGRDLDGDGVPDLQEVEDRTDWKNPLSNSLFLEVTGEFEVGKTVSFSLVHPKLGRIKKAFFLVSTKNNEFKLFTTTGIAKYDVVDSGVQRVIAGTGKFRLTQDLIPFCTLSLNKKNAFPDIIKTFLLLFYSVSIGLLAVNFDLRHFKKISFYARPFLRTFTLLFAGTLFLLPFLVLLFFEPFGQVQARILAFVAAYLELIFVFVLHFYYSFKPLPLTQATERSSFKLVLPKLSLKNFSVKLKSFFTGLRNLLVQSKPVSKKQELELKIERMRQIESRLLKIKADIEESNALPEEKQVALQKVWQPLNEVRREINDLEKELKNLKE